MFKISNVTLYVLNNKTKKAIIFLRNIYLLPCSFPKLNLPKADSNARKRAKSKRRKSDSAKTKLTAFGLMAQRLEAPADGNRTLVGSGGVSLLPHCTEALRRKLQQNLPKGKPGEPPASEVGSACRL